MTSFKQGALIAIAAGGLFAAACKKDEARPADKAGEMKPAGDPKAGDPKAGEVKPAGMAGDMKTAEKTDKVQCMGVNECKGKGACKTDANACAGQNGCGKKGFVELAEEECKAKGGAVMAKK